MVRRLVKQQERRLAQKDLCQFDAHIPALREGLGVALKVFGLESQTFKRSFGLHLGRLAAAQLHAVVQKGQFLYESSIFI